jgi:hypothetical protein
MEDVVIEVNKGTVTAIYSDANLRFVVVDWDLRERVERGEALGSEVGKSAFSAMSQDVVNQYKQTTN